MATNDARLAPAGWIATAVTSGAVGVSFAPITRAATACEPSSGVPSGSVRVTMTGVSGPAQMLLDTDEHAQVIARAGAAGERARRRGRRGM